MSTCHVLIADDQEPGTQPKIIVFERGADAIALQEAMNELGFTATGVYEVEYRYGKD